MKITGYEVMGLALLLAAMQAQSAGTDRQVIFVRMTRAVGNSLPFSRLP
jgi:hypothetical protein